VQCLTRAAAVANASSSDSGIELGITNTVNHHCYATVLPSIDYFCGTAHLNLVAMALAGYSNFASSSNSTGNTVTSSSPAPTAPLLWRELCNQPGIVNELKHPYLKACFAFLSSDIPGSTSSATGGSMGDRVHHHHHHHSQQQQHSNKLGFSEIVGEECEIALLDKIAFACRFLSDTEVCATTSCGLAK
jgi:hypothetical protein